MKNAKKAFLRGVRDGVPIGLAYLSVSFAFGIFAVGNGLSALEAVFISMTNVTSAGQLAAVPIFAGIGSLAELAFTQLVINLRYALMSVSIAQRFDGSIRFVDRFLIAFVDTDEVFGVACSQPVKLSRSYMYGLILLPYVSWSAGTLIGSLAGNALPPLLTSALGLAIYGMFIAIVFPVAKRSVSTAECVLLAIGLKCLFRYVPALQKVPEGFSVIICAVLASLLFTFLDSRAAGKGSGGK